MRKYVYRIPLASIQEAAGCLRFNEHNEIRAMLLYMDVAKSYWVNPNEFPSCVLCAPDFSHYYSWGNGENHEIASGYIAALIEELALILPSNFKGVSAVWDVSELQQVRTSVVPHVPACNPVKAIQK